MIGVDRKQIALQVEDPIHVDAIFKMVGNNAFLHYSEVKDLDKSS